MRSTAPFRLASFVFASALLGCSSPTDSGFQGRDGGPDGAIEPTNPDANIDLPDSGPVSSDTPIGSIKGKAFAPDGMLPLPGAVLYLTTQPPPEGPRGAICDTCIDLTTLPAHATSAIDGTFDLPIFKPGKQYLVIEKGRFRRVRQVDLRDGLNAVPTEITSIPGRNDPAVGDYAPKVLVVPTSIATFDNVQNTLRSLNFDFEAQTGAVADATIRNKTKMKEYSFVFLPCGTNDQETCVDPTALDGTVKSTLVDYVKSGGRLYVTDYAYEYVRQGWPKHIHWYNTPVNDATTSAGNGCDRTEIKRAGTWMDPGLKQWMGVVGNNPNGEQLTGIYTTIEGVNPVMGESPSGAPVSITPKVWVAANGKPSTVTFPDRCGRVLFSTNHTDGGQAGALLAQEKAIVYTLLEVSTCILGNVDK
jgi:hypothetical protein